MTEPKYSVGDRVYYLGRAQIKAANVEVIHSFQSELETVYDLSNNNVQCENSLFPTKQALLEHVTKQIEELE